jgi:hypothetical protein
MDTRNFVDYRKLRDDLVKDLESLSNNLITDIDKLKEFGERWRNGFHMYSMHNMLLIWSQCPAATLVAGRKQWQDRYSRKLKSNQYNNSIQILAPEFNYFPQKDDDGNVVKDSDGKPVMIKMLKYFRVVFVYDIGQTEGKPVDFGGSQLYKEKNSGYKLEDIAKLFPYELVFIKPSNVLMTNGSTDGKNINIARHDGNENADVATYFHEVAHNLLGHTNHDKPEQIPERHIGELEAEATSYLVCSVLGIEHVLAANYISGWVRDNQQETLTNSGSKVLTAAEKIIKTVLPPK